MENKYENYFPLFQIWRAGLGVKSRTRGQEGHRFESWPETFFWSFKKKLCPNAVKMIGKWHGCVTSNPIKMTCIFHRNSIEFDGNVIGIPWDLPSFSTKLPSKWHGKNPCHIFSRDINLFLILNTSMLLVLNAKLINSYRLPFKFHW